MLNRILVILRESSILWKLFLICLIFNVFGPYSSSFEDRIQEQVERIENNLTTSLQKGKVNNIFYC